MVTEDTHVFEKGQRVTVQVAVGDYELEEEHHQHIALLELEPPQQQHSQQQSRDDIPRMMARNRKARARGKVTAVPNRTNRSTVRVQVQKPR